MKVITLAITLQGLLITSLSGQFVDSTSVLDTAPYFGTNVPTLDSMDVAHKLDSVLKIVSPMLYFNTEQQKALPKIDSMRELVVSTIGRNTLEYVKCNFWKGRALVELGRYKEAEPLLLEAKHIQEEVVGTRIIYGIILGLLSEICLHTDRLELGELYILGSVEYYRTKTVPYWDRANKHNYLGDFYTRKEDFEKAEAAYIESAEIFRVNGDTTSYLFTDNLADLGNLYMLKSRYQESEALLHKARSVYEASPYKNIRYHIVILHNLSVYYKTVGQYDKAEQLLLESNELLRSYYGANNVHFVSGLINLADYLASTGRLEECKTTLLEAKGILEDSGYIEHSMYASVLVSLAGLPESVYGDTSVVELYLNAKEIDEQNLGRMNSDYAVILLNLADYYRNTGRKKESERYFLEARDILFHIHGDNHILYANCLQGLGELYLDDDRLAEAETLILTAHDTYLRLLGRSNHVYANNLYLLGRLYFAQDRIREMEDVLSELSLIDQEQVRRGVNFMSAHELFNLIKLYEQRLNAVCVYASSVTSDRSTKLRQIAFDNVLYYKGFLLKAADQLRAHSEHDTTYALLREELKRDQRLLAIEYSKRKELRDSLSLYNLEKKVNNNEKQLVRNVSKYAEIIKDIVCSDVRGALKDDEIAIEFVKLNKDITGLNDSIMYVALVISPGSSVPTLIPLFPEEKLKELIDGNDTRRQEYVGRLYQVKKGASDKDLYGLIWQPLKPLLRGVNRVYYSPAGLLHRINLSGIQINDASSVSDQFDLVQVGSTRELTYPNIISQDNNGCILFGAIEYNIDTSILQIQNVDSSGADLVLRSELNFAPDSTLRGGSWNYLAGSEMEIHSIQSVLKESDYASLLYKREQATEETFKSLGENLWGKKSPRILHITTHGYFFPDPKEIKAHTLTSDYQPVFKISDHPMIRSGLILAGGNYAWNHGHSYKLGMEDGILTAHEISQMDLSDTELVVLSACETGLGDIEGNEGVYGLQRAFKIAGVKNLIMSLWQVPDKATAELMTMFYENWLIKEMTIRQALHAAQKTMRDQGYEHFYWAGFVLVE